MTASRRFGRTLAILLAFAATLGFASAAELIPAAVAYKLPDQIPWEGPSTTTVAEDKMTPARAIHSITGS